jgi:alpha-1,3-rhamnosyl/mannosyltransferase
LLIEELKGTETAEMLGDAGAHIHYCDFPVASLRQWIKLPFVVRRLGPDVYHYPFLDMPYVPSVSVVTIYDLNPILTRDYFTGQRMVRRIIARRMLRSTLKRCRLALTISDDVRRLLDEHFREGRGKTRTIRLGVDGTFWTQAQLPADRESKDGDDDGRWLGRPYVLYVGVDRPHKNLIRLVRAFESFSLSSEWRRDKVPYLWLAGVGQGSPELQAELESSGLRGRVRLTDGASEGVLRRIYRGARLVAYVSVSEGFGLPILEALSAGIPVVCGNASSLPEVAGDAAVYVTPEDEADIARGITRLWSDQPLRDVLVQRGIRRVQEFSWDRTAQSTLQAYNDVVRHPLTTVEC